MSNQSRFSNWDEVYEEYYEDQFPAFGGPFTNTLKFHEWLNIYYPNGIIFKTQQQHIPPDYIMD